MRANRPITSRSGKSPNDTVLTPNWLFEKLKLDFDLDPAHPPFKTNVPCKSYYTEEQDGLNQPWKGIIWLNPPYSKPSVWVDKFIEHNNGIALLPIAKSYWFNKLWENADAIICLNANFKFERIDNLRKDIFMPVCLIGMGKKASKALKNSKIGKVR